MIIPLVRTLLIALALVGTAVAADERKSIGDLELRFSGPNSRKELARFLIAFDECRGQRGAGCPAALAHPKFRKKPSDPAPRATAVQLYDAAQEAKFWPDRSVSGTETIFEKHFLKRYLAHGKGAFHSAVKVELFWRQFRAAVWVPEGEKWPTNPKDLSSGIVKELCATFSTTTRLDCVIHLERPAAVPLTKPLSRNGKTTTLTRQYAWIVQPSFEAMLDLDTDRAAVDEVASWLERKLFSQDPQRIPATFARFISNAPSGDLNESQISQPDENQDCDFPKRIRWLGKVENQTNFPIFIADSSIQQKKEFEKYVATVRTNATDSGRIKLRGRPLVCRELQPSHPAGISHTAAVAALVGSQSTGMPKATLGLLPEADIRVIELGEWMLSGRILTGSGTDYSTARQQSTVRKPITIVPGNRRESTDFKNEDQPLFPIPGPRAVRQTERSQLLGLAQADGTFTILAAPSVDKVDLKGRNSMMASIRHYKFLAPKTPILQPRHELQQQSKVGWCPVFPICYATTPLAMGVAALGSDDKQLLDPDRYLLGSGWIWVAAPGASIPVAAELVKLSSDQATQSNLMVECRYFGSSFAVATVGALMQQVIDYTRTSTDYTGTSAGKATAYKATAYDAAAIIAAASDLINPDEKVEIRGQDVDLGLLVRYGRVNFQRTLTIAKETQLSEPSLLPVVVGAGSRQDQPPTIHVFPRGELKINKAIAVEGSNCSLRVTVPNGHNDLREWMASSDGAVFICLALGDILRISASRNLSGQIVYGGKDEKVPLLDIVFLSSLEIGREANRAYESSLQSFRFPLILRRVALTKTTSIPTDIEAADCALLSGDGDNREDACLYIEHLGQNVFVNLQTHDYFGRVFNGK